MPLVYMYLHCHLCYTCYSDDLLTTLSQSEWSLKPLLGKFQKSELTLGILACMIYHQKGKNLTSIC